MLIHKIALFFLIIFLLQYFWNRRKLYIASWKMNGPIAWPIIGNSLILIYVSKIHTKISEICEKYKSPIRFWLFQRFIIFTSDPEQIEIILNAPEAIDRGQISEILYNVIGGDGLFTNRGEDWRLHRKYLNPTMRYKVVNGHYPIFNKFTKKLINQLNEHVDRNSIDLYKYFYKCTLGMIIETMCGVEVDVDNQIEFNITDAINTLSESVGLRMYQPWYNIKTIFRKSKFYNEYLKSQDMVDIFLNKLEENRHLRLANKSKSEIFDTDKSHENAVDISKGDTDNNEDVDDDHDGSDSENDENIGIASRDIYIDHCWRLVEENKITIDELKYETKTMFVGGFETTATAASFVMLMLAMHPLYQAKVFNEIREIFPERDTTVTAEHLSKMEYTDRVIKETLRLFPVIPIGSRYAADDFEMGKDKIPAGTDLLIGFYVLHHNKEIWGDRADEFDPDNFLPERLIDKHPYSYLPFGAGPRNCIGLKYGNIVVRMLLVWIVRHFWLSTSLKMSDLNFRMDVTLKLLNRHMVYVYKREEY